MNKTLVAVLLTLGGMTQAVANTITVTTVADEDGTNSSSCSLREAIKAAESNAAYGGCSAGGGRSDLIQLADTSASAPYTVLTPLPEIYSSLTIRGAETFDTDVTDPLNGGPKRVPAKTTIERSTATGTPDFRLFVFRAKPGDQYASMPSVALEGLRLRNGRAAANPAATFEADRRGWGGAIYLEASLTLNNVQLVGNRAAERGGAIFVAGDGSALTTNIAWFKDNEASEGAAISTASCGGQLANSRTITLANSSFTGNGKTLDVGFVNTQGAAIQVCGKTALKMTVATIAQNGNGVGAAIDADENNPAALEFSSITMVENAGAALLMSSNTQSTLSLNNSLIAFNGGAAADCFPAARVATRNTNKLDASCTDASSASQGIGTTTFNEILWPLAAYNGVTPASQEPENALTLGYLPKLASDTGAAVATALLVDNGSADATACDGFDQRGVVHLVGAKCDIGALERKQLVANKDAATNAGGYRQVLADILSNDTASESIAADGTHAIVDISKVKTSPTDTTGAVDVVLTDNQSGKCQWKTVDVDINGDGKFDGTKNRLVLENNGALTATDTPVKCKYKLKEIATNAESAEVEVALTVINNAPIAVADTVTRPDGGGIVISLLDNDKDNDGTRTDPISGQVINVDRITGIKITKFPDLGTLYCISENNKKMFTNIRNNKEEGVDICTGDGRLRYEPDNNLSPFTDKFEYVARDRENAESNKATVTVRVDVPRPGTAGSLPLLSLAVLALLGWRRRAVTRM